MTINDLAWDKVFDEYGLLDAIEVQGFADLTADQIRRFREPRLMAKIDHSKDLPSIFERFSLNILPTSTGTYRVGPYKLFQPILGTGIGEVSALPIPEKIETIDFQNLSGESSVLHAALVSNILQQFTGEELTLTVSGRMRSGEFDFSVARTDLGQASIKVSGAQIEIDGGFEGPESLYLFEVKNHKATDFNIRQLYYPYRVMKEKFKKPVKTAYLTYEKGEFEIYEYHFSDLKDFSSLELVRSGRFCLTQSRVTPKVLLDAARLGIGAAPNLGAPFPQADSFERVIDLVAALVEKPRTLDDFTQSYGFDERQSSYYFAAASYLGLATSQTTIDGKKVLVPTPLGNSTFRGTRESRNLALAKLILSHDSFARVFIEFVNMGVMPPNEDIEKSLYSSPDFEFYGDSTVRRRIKTVKSWCKWILSLTK